MNKLSSILWLSDIFPALGILCGIIGFLPIAGSIALTVCGIFVHATYGGDESKTFWENVRVRCSKLSRCTWVVAVLCIILSIVSPSKTTVMAIAASEASEMVIKSETGKEVAGEALAAVRARLQESIKPKESKK